MDPLDMDRVLRRQAWDVYAASLLSMNNHPGTTQGRAVKRTIAEVAEEADRMLAERDRRVMEGRL